MTTKAMEEAVCGHLAWALVGSGEPVYDGYGSEGARTLSHPKAVGECFSN